MSNARNLANLLGTGTQIQTGDIASGAVTTAKIADGAFQANKNLIINGAMRVWQRGTSFTKVGNGYGFYTADRWALYYDDTEVEKQEDTINGEIVDTLKVTAAGSNGRRYFYQQIEDGSVLISGKTCTVSFWFKSSNTRSFELQIRFNSGGFGPNADNQTVTTFTPSSVNTWEKFEFSFSATDGFYAKGRVAGLWISCNENDDFGSDSTAQITQVQLELGDTATPFEHRSYGEELAACKRFYRNFIDANASAVGFMPAKYSESTSHWLTVVLNPEMRAAPTVTVSTWQNQTPSLYKSNPKDITLYNASGSYYSNVNTTFVADAEL